MQTLRASVQHQNESSNFDMAAARRYFVGLESLACEAKQSTNCGFSSIPITHSPLKPITDSPPIPISVLP